jgi:uncharacterized membrane protein HdeD (DUF308 family)
MLLQIHARTKQVRVEEANQLNMENGSWKIMLIALALIIFGIFLMFQSLNTLFDTSSLVFVAMILSALFIFSGIVLLIIAIAAIAAI